MIVVVLLFLAGLALLWKGGDLFVDQAAYFARRFGISEIVIGATIVSIGTTLPETTVSALASLGGTPAIAYGNALGSVICNTGLVAGLLLLLRPGRADRGEVAFGALFFFAAAIAFALIASRFGVIDRWAGWVLNGLFLSYLVSSVLRARRASMGRAEQNASEPKRAALKHALLMALSALLIFLGSRLLIANGTEIAWALGVPERVIALTFIALGTSLPELATAVIAIARGHGALSLGNIIGANFLNLTLVLGLSAVLAPIPAPVSSLLNDVRALAVPMLLLTLPTFIRGGTMRVQGALLIGIYAFYCYRLF